MDGENKGKPYEQMDDLEGKTPYFWFNTQYGHQPQEKNGIYTPIGLMMFILLQQHSSISSDSCTRTWETDNC